MTSTPPLLPSALRDAEPKVYWTDRPDAPTATDPLSGPTSADLVIIGGGLTGLWAAIEAKDRDPARDVVVLEAGEVASGASGRNGGFISESLTHGLAHGLHMWPDEMPTLIRLGRENLAEIAAFIEDEKIDADLRLCGKTVVAVRPHQVAELEASHRLHLAHGEDVALLGHEAARRDVASPTFLAALRVRSGGGLVDPARLTWGLRAAAIARGVRLLENTPALGLERSGTGVSVTTPHGRVDAGRVILATNAFPPLLRRLRAWMLPVYDHVLMTAPLSADQIASIGWTERQGMTDSGNQFHYYRRTEDDRILWGGYDAIYYFGGRTDPALEQRDSSHELLASQFFTTFPQLSGLRFSHRWAGAIDSTSRFTPVFGTALDGRVSYSLGYTGLGVAASRFGARVALDLVDGADTERTRLGLVRRRPVPFPPEPIRYSLVQATRAALAREDESGRRGPWLKLLDRFGVGFNS